MDKIAVLDFGGQYAHLIANRIRRLGVYTEIHDGEVSAEELREYKGLILSGGPSSVHAEDGLKCDPTIFELGIPILGICYGHQLVAHTLGGKVENGKVREYGSAVVKINDKRGILEGVKDEEKVWMSHFDQITKVPSGFEVTASTADCPIAGMINLKHKIFTVQFHPEVTHTPCGMTVLENFVRLTGASRDWNIDRYIEDISDEIKAKVGDKKVFLLISGGVDSTVAFLLLAKALGQDRVYGLFVDIGFMRKNERKEVEEALTKVGVTNLHVYDASEEYFSALEGKYEPEEKRKIIGELFVDIQAKVSEDLNLNPQEWIIAQGTIYPDTIETGGTKHADKIKTHHNRVDKMQKLIDEERVIEPIAQLYKDEVRLVGERLGLADEMVWRHPFPGPGLAVRTLCIEGEDKVEGVEELELQMNEVVKYSGFKVKVLPIKSVGVQGDERTYAHPAVVYGGEIDWDLLNKLSTQLTNQFSMVNRVILGLRPGVFNSWVVKKSYLTKERISVIQDADKIVMDFIREQGLHRDIWQFPTVLIPVDVSGDGRSGSESERVESGDDNENGYAGVNESIVLRPVCSQEAMTANFYGMEAAKLNELVKRLASVKGVSGIFYDITNKPPGTIEWE